MNKYRFIKVLLSPSLASGMAIILVTLSFIGFNIWIFLTEEPMFRQYLFGANGVGTILVAMPSSEEAFTRLLFGSPATYYILLAATGIVAGLTVYSVLQGLGRIVQNTSSALRGARNAGLIYKEQIREIFTRLALRVIVFVFWTIYISAFVTILLPFCSTFLHRGMQDVAAGDLGGWLYLVGSTLLFVVALHANVLFARVFLLRLRIFGSRDAELAGL